MRLQTRQIKYKALLKDNPIGLSAPPVVGMDGNGRHVLNGERDV